MQAIRASFIAGRPSTLCTFRCRMTIARHGKDRQPRQPADNHCYVVLGASKTAMDTGGFRGPIGRYWAQDLDFEASKNAPEKTNAILERFVRNLA